MRLILVLAFFILANITWGQGQKVKISTEFGDMIVLLYDDTPLHKENFLNHVKNKAYDGTLFHRVINGFMFQGGDFGSVDATSEQMLGADKCSQLNNEIRTNHFHKKGAIAAARLPDSINPNKMSSGCQFFIVQGNKYNDNQLNNMETQHYKFPDINRAFYKVRGGTPILDMQYTVFGEVIEGLEVIDLISAVPTGKYLKDRPNTDIKMEITIID